MIVQKHMQKWPKKVQKYNPQDTSTWLEVPRLVFRRNVLSNVGKEQALLDIDNEAVLQLIYHEAMHNYLIGLYPCSEQVRALSDFTLIQIRVRLFTLTLVKVSKGEG